MARAKRRTLAVHWAIIIFTASLVCTLCIMIALAKPTTVDTVLPFDQEKGSSEAGIGTVDTPSILYGIPTRLKIPKIGVDTTIVSIGLTDDGDMEAPKTNEHAGWYKYGARPGNQGSAVIAGHYGLKGDAVFGKLGLLEKGDSILVNDERGRTAKFIVTETRQYSFNDSPKEVFTSTDGAHLNLITCDGDWNTDHNTYSDRLVVFTERYSE